MIVASERICTLPEEVRTGDLLVLDTKGKNAQRDKTKRGCPTKG